jgi:hypothetical protein
LAYRWLQQLCGVHHLDGNPVVESTGVTSQHLISFADCVKAIRARVMTRAVLLAQAAKLGLFGSINFFDFSIIQISIIVLVQRHWSFPLM